MVFCDTRGEGATVVCDVCGSVFVVDEVTGQRTCELSHVCEVCEIRNEKTK